MGEVERVVFVIPAQETVDFFVRYIRATQVGL
jgi:hypothetical protein